MEAGRKGKGTKRHWLKRLAAVVLSLCMMTGIAVVEPVEAQAAGSPSWYSSAYNNSNPYAMSGYYGQCTWYAWGRAFEVTGKSLPCKRDAKNWYAEARSAGWSVGSEPRANSIAVWDKGVNGHVAYVESVNGSSVTISEANFRSDYLDDQCWFLEVGMQYYDGIRSLTVSQMQSRYGTLLGYIYLGSPAAPSTPSVPRGSRMETGGSKVIQDGDYYISSALTGSRANPGKKCLTIEGLTGSKNHNGANALLWGCLGNADHVFTVKWLGNGFYKIKLKSSDNKCLDVSDAGTEEGTNVQQWEDNGTDAQQWVIAQNGDGYTIQARCSGYYLDVDNGNTADGTNIRMWSGNNSLAQKWYFVPYDSRMETGGSRVIQDGDYYISSALTGSRANPGKKCLTVGGLPGSKNDNSANAELWGVLGDSDHVFTVKWLGNGFYKIKLKISDNKCLDVDNCGMAEGTNVQQWEDNGTDAQQWVIAQNGDGYTIQARCSGYYLDVDNGNTADGTNIRVWSGNNSLAQRWYFVPYNKQVNVNSVRLNKSSLTLNTGGQSALTATVSPTNATNQTLTWKSSKPAVATVDSNGVVTAKSAGTATVTVKTSNGKTATCQVTVKKKTSEKVDVKSVRLNKSSLTLETGGQSTLTATVSPTNATNQTLTWKSSKPAVAAVDTNGVVTAKSAGKATVTVKTPNGKTAACTVVVETQTDGDTDDEIDDETADCTHSYRRTVTPATMEADGSIVEECRKCGDEKSRTVIPAIDTVILSKTRFLYNGREQEPEVTVEDNDGGTLTEGEDYTVSVDGNEKKVGRYTVVVEFEGNYEGEVERTFDIIPKGTAITGLTAEKNGFRMSWGKRTSQTTGYEIAYSTSPRFTKASTKTVLVKKNKTTSWSVLELKSGKKYYVRVRTYKTVKFAGETIKVYSGWSEKRAVVTKR